MQVTVTYHQHPDPACVLARITVNGVARDAVIRNPAGRAALESAKKLLPAAAPVR